MIDSNPRGVEEYSNVHRTDVPETKNPLSSPDSPGTLCAPGVIEGYIQTKRLADFIPLLTALTSNERADVLASHNAVWNLAFNGYASEVVHLLEDLTADQQARVLTSGSALEALLVRGQLGPVFELIKKLGPEAQSIALATKYAIPGYLSSTRELAGETFDIIARLSPEQQTRVLSINYVVKSLAIKGLALDVFDLIASLDTFQKARICVAKGYHEVVSFCTRRESARQPPRRQPDPSPLMSG